MTLADYLIAVQDLEDSEPEQEESTLLCAWCLSEQGVTPTEGSHGICVDHASAVLTAHRERRARG